MMPLITRWKLKGALWQNTDFFRLDLIAPHSTPSNAPLLSSLIPQRWVLFFWWPCFFFCQTPAEHDEWKRYKCLFSFLHLLNSIASFFCLCSVKVRLTRSHYRRYQSLCFCSAAAPPICDDWPETSWNLSCVTRETHAHTRCEDTTTQWLLKPD